MAGPEECKGERAVSVVIGQDGTPHIEENYVMERISALKADLAKLREAVSEIHIIIHSRRTPIRAYLSKNRAMADYEELRKDKNAVGSYGVISLPVEDAIHFESATKEEK
ncbi:hypothetical protein KAR91_34775 [Candidatus Pacearchaeota archaeon]|nr:hypothetical protein [Candidatus Pacearchaeota archaeon]